MESTACVREVKPGEIVHWVDIDIPPSIMAKILDYAHDAFKSEPDYNNLILLHATVTVKAMIVHSKLKESTIAEQRNEGSTGKQANPAGDNQKEPGTA